MASRRRTPSPTTTREIFTLGTHSWRKLDAACSLPSTSNLAPLDWVREDDPYTACAIQTGFRLKGSVWVEVYESGAENWTVRCRCGARDDDGDRMVSCDVYEIRQHTSGIEDFDVNNISIASLEWAVQCTRTTRKEFTLVFFCLCALNGHGSGFVVNL
ncbi:hypothetical protein RHMOL_Rhmol10G0265500 [Rhododendron molle]|uniref:Uncharacterized protein n=1 Tax=Rhododendron molle TaxID=49168 RepID=A0ACC0M7I4_RHOML|nr:hypothetical protein RHMOL_Rhmol10G0265500 [Rhododendron molle]